MISLLHQTQHQLPDPLGREGREGGRGGGRRGGRVGGREGGKVNEGGVGNE